jgi:coenzyme F420 hydrogenase subunit beta
VFLCKIGQDNFSPKQETKMSNIPKVLEFVVKNDLCIGCGLCVYKCPTKGLTTAWNENGFLIPKLSGTCDDTGDCISVCPFNPFPEKEVKTENELAEIFLKEATETVPKIGKYIGLYAGYSEDFRLTSSSGGVATFIFSELLERGIVKHIFSVKESQNQGEHYAYSISSSKEEIFNASKTRYYPVTLATVLPKIHELEGEVAIVGVACFIKAIRLAQHKEPKLKEKIPFLVGIICGGVKSRFFTEYLAGKVEINIGNIKNPQYRIKHLNRSAGDYSFGCYDKSNNKMNTIRMREVGDMWGSGMFKNNACDFCDDVTTELSDISLGDAWIEPFAKDGRGTNVIATRSLLAEELIQIGVATGKLQIEKLTIDHFLTSQKGSFNHRHTGLSVRMAKARKHGKLIPPKRFTKENITFVFKVVQCFRMIIRFNSLKFWQLYPDAEIFDRKMAKFINRLNRFTHVYHYYNYIKFRVKQKFNLK